MSFPSAQIVMDDEEEESATDSRKDRNSVSNSSSSGTTTASSSAGGNVTTVARTLNAKPMEKIVTSPYENDECAEMDEEIFEELILLLTHTPSTLSVDNSKTIDSEFVSEHTFGDKLASFIHCARREIGKDQECYRSGWASGKIRGKECGWVPKKHLLLCLYGDRIANASENSLYCIVRDLRCAKAVHAAMKEWKLQDKFPELSSCSKFSYESNKVNCSKCEIFVARAYFAAQVLKKLDLVAPTLCEKINTSLTIMNDHVRVNAEKLEKWKLKLKRRSVKNKTSRHEDGSDDPGPVQGPLKEIYVESTESVVATGTARNINTSQATSSPPMRLLNHDERLMTLRSLYNVVKEQHDRFGQTLDLLSDSIALHKRLTREEMRKEVRAEFEQQEMKIEKQKCPSSSDARVGRTDPGRTSSSGRKRRRMTK
jgi:hypothetical protein